jgi:hypothetical protein
MLGGSMRDRLRESLVLAAVLAAGIGWIVSPCERGTPARSGAGTATPAEPATREELDALRRALADQGATLLALADELALLRDEIAALGGGIPSTGEPIPGAEEGGASDAPGVAGADDAPAAATPSERPSFDAEGLLAAGLAAREVEGLRERWERLQLEQLELNDRALREGWLFTPRHQDEQRALTTAFRDELGEEGYDAYLFATGQPNRVLVKEVLGNSQASRAGVLPGDVIVSYDGARTFVPRDLQLATAQGRRGEMVRIEVVREGRPVTLQVQRGPLGIILRGSAEPPRSNS